MSEELVKNLWAARTSGGTLTRDLASGLVTAEDAYEVQKNIAALSGMERGGWKIGATSDVAQKLIGISGPAAAPLFVPLCYQSPATFAMFPGQSTSVESEFAFRLSNDLPPRHSQYHREEVIDAISTVMPAIEIVSCRFEGGFAGLGELCLIADSVGNAAWARGPETSNWRQVDLVNHIVTLRRGEQQIANGTGAEVLGDPLNVLLWTVNHLSSRGIGLSAGEIVSTGTCTGVVAVAPGETMIADFNELGLVEVTLEEHV